MSDDEFARYQPHLVRQWQQRQQRLSSAGNLVSRKELETFMRHHPLRKTFIKDIVDGPLTEQQLIRALQRRATPLSSNQTDLEYVSLRCIDRIVGAACDRSGSSEGPRLGTFTFWPQVLFGAHFDMWTFVLRTAAAARGCTTGWRADRLAVLGIEFPTYSPSAGVHDWSNPASPLFVTLTSSQVATHDAWWDPSAPTIPRERMFTIPYGRSSDGGLGGSSQHRRDRRSSLWHERPYLAAFLGNADPSNPLRQQLHRECAAATSICLGNPPKLPAPSSWWRRLIGTRKEQRTQIANVSAYAQARFCLQPWGDTATRRGFFDALSSGCIPVIFDEAGYSELSEWFGHPRTYSLLLPYREIRNAPNVSVLERLRRIPSAQVAALAEGVRRKGQRLLYSHEGRSRARGSSALHSPDAADMIVSGLAHMWRVPHAV